MSYDIYLTDPVTHEPLKLEAAHHMRGGTYAMSGTTEAWLNITYNYADWYYRPGVCFNGDSPSCADFTEPNQRCREWERKEEDYVKK